MENDEKSPVREGDILAGKYRVERVLGVGGVGIVVAATHVELDQQVALKFLRPSALQNEDAVERFLREARAVVRMKSEHAVKVLDVGKLENGAPYMVMELLVGCDFASLMVERGALPVAEAVDYLLQACEALAEAHQLGIIHRDLKPENLFLTTGADHRPLVKVLDFGLLKTTGGPVQGRSERALTGTMVMGTPSYMSPEQWTTTSTVDARTDIWALGVVLYELLTNRLPFEAEATSELIAMVARDAPKPVSAHRRDVPVALVDVISRCLEKNPEKRFTKVSKLAAALAAFVGDYGSESISRIKRMQLSVMPPPTPGNAQMAAPFEATARQNLATQAAIDPAVVDAARRDPATRVSWGDPLAVPPTGKRTGRTFLIGLLAIVGVFGAGLYMVKYQGARAIEGPAPTLDSVRLVSPESPALPMPGTASAPMTANPPPTSTEGSTPAAVATKSSALPPRPNVRAPRKDAGAPHDADRRLLDTR